MTKIEIIYFKNIRNLIPRVIPIIPKRMLRGSMAFEKIRAKSMSVRSHFCWLISDWWRRLFYVVVEPPTGNILVKLLVPKNLSSANNNTGVHRPLFDGAPVEVARAWCRPPGKWSRTRSRENYGLHPWAFCPGPPFGNSYTLPETNSQFAPENWMVVRRSGFLLQCHPFESFHVSFLVGGFNPFAKY